MIKRIIRVLLLTLFIVSLFSIGNAQKTTTTGVINGTVLDDQNLPLPGVTVTATSPALMLPQVSTLTDNNGFFRFPELPVGYYEVTFELSGFTTIVQKKVKIDFSKTIYLNIKMTLSPIEEKVTVIAKAPTIDKESSSLGVNLDSTLLRSVPANREFRQVYDMAPGVSERATHGSTVKDDSYTVDGVIFGDPVGGTTFTRVGWEVGEEYMVETTGHSAEHGSSRGAVFNIITKSGGNRFSGEANLYYTNKSLLGNNSKGTPFEDQFVGFNYHVDTTFQLGGPIFKDKLWFFANLTFQYREDYVQDFPYDKPEQIPVGRTYLTPYVKLSWQINPSMKLVGSWDYPPFWRLHRKASWQRNEDTTWKQMNVVGKYHLTYSWIINENLIFSAKGGAMFFDYDLEAHNNSPRYYDYSTRLYSGSYGYSDYYNTRRLQFKTDLAYFLDDLYGRHEFKTGFEAQFSQRLRECYHNYTEGGLGPYIYTRNNGQPYRVLIAQDFNPKEKLRAFGLFVQDRWSPTKRLTLNLGLRYDHQEGIIPAQGQDREPYTYEGVTYNLSVPKDLKPITWNTISPRLGAAYDLTGDGKTILKASFSKYHLENIINYFTGVNPNGSFNRYYYLNPDWTLGNMYSLYTTSTSSIDPDLTPSSMTELVVGIQRELLPDLVLSASYIRKWDRNIIEDIILEALDLDAIKAGDYVWSGYTPVTAVDPYDGKTVTFYNRSKEMVAQTKYLTNPQNAKREYTGLEFVLNKKFSHNWQMLLSYVYAKPSGIMSTDGTGSSSYSTLFNDPNVHINAIGRFPNERRHQFKFQGSVRAPLGILLSTYFRALSGLRYTRSIRSLDLGLKLNQGNVTIYAEERGSRGLPSLYIWDLRIEKQFSIANLFRLSLIVDGFNLLNRNAATSVEKLSSIGDNFEVARSIMEPRSLRLAIRVTW